MIYEVVSTVEGDEKVIGDGLVKYNLSKVPATQDCLNGSWNCNDR